MATKLPASFIAKIRERAIAQYDEYFVSESANRVYQVVRKGDASRAYEVDLDFLQTCNCPAFEKDHYCKHVAMCQYFEIQKRHMDEVNRFLKR